MPEGLLAPDTNALSAWMRRDEKIERRLRDVSPALPVSALQEACYGWILAARKAEQRSREDLAAEHLDLLAALIEFSRNLVILRYTPEAQAIYRSLRRGRGNRGREDLRIAAICLAHDTGLLTRNVTDFSDFPGLRVASW
jgi:tRNA(fMet)-specific endonuclease VapC